MALFGSIGKVLRVVFPVVYYPTAAVVRAASGEGAAGVSRTVQEAKANTVQPFARAIAASAATGAQNRAIDDPTPRQEAPQYQQNLPSDYFQPTQFSGGSYDPSIGGGYPSWDSGTSWDWEEPSQVPTQGYSEIWD